jgi:type VI protein secretion system component Hcp
MDMWRSLLVVTFSLLLLAGIAGTASAAYEFYMWVDGVAGDITRPEYRGWMGFYSLTHELEALPPVPELLLMAEPRSPGRSGPGGMDLVKTYDKASPKLFALCNAGQRRPMKLALMSTVGDKRIVVNYELKNVMVEHILLRAPGFGDRSNLLRPLPLTKPMEELRLNFEEVKWSWGVIRP